MKDELGRKIIENFAGLKPKTCNYLKDDGSDDKKTKGKKKCDKNIKLNLKITKPALKIMLTF